MLSFLYITVLKKAKQSAGNFDESVSEIEDELCFTVDIKPEIVFGPGNFHNDFIDAQFLEIEFQKKELLMIVSSNIGAKRMCQLWIAAC